MTKQEATLSFAKDSSIIEFTADGKLSIYLPRPASKDQNATQGEMMATIVAAFLDDEELVLAVAKKLGMLLETIKGTH